MSLETFRTILPFFKRTLLVYLQGWGEPFLNPDFFEMIRLAKQTGTRIGTTTNGMDLNEEKINRLIESGIDIITFSLAGIDKQNDKIRRGTDFNQIIRSIELINLEKRKRNLEKPEIHIAYLLLKSGLEEILYLPKALYGKGINQVIISTLDFVPKPELEEETIKPKSSDDLSKIRDQLEKVVNEGKEKNLNIYYRTFNPREKRLFCVENIQKSLYISSDGSISPCVFTNLPTNLTTDNLNFGNVEQKALSKIWRDKSYKKFRNSFRTKNLYQSCEKCPKIYLA